MNSYEMLMFIGKAKITKTCSNIGINAVAVSDKFTYLLLHYSFY